MNSFDWGDTSGRMMMLAIWCGCRAIEGPWQPPWPRWVDGVIAFVAFVLSVAINVRRRRSAA